MARSPPDNPSWRSGGGVLLCGGLHPTSSGGPTVATGGTIGTEARRMVWRISEDTLGTKWRPPWPMLPRRKWGREGSAAWYIVALFALVLPCICPPLGLCFSTLVRQFLPHTIPRWGGTTWASRVPAPAVGRSTSEERSARASRARGAQTMSSVCARVLPEALSALDPPRLQRLGVSHRHAMKLRMGIAEPAP